MKYLDSNPDVASGHLVIKGTRIRIAHVLKLVVEGHSIEDIRSEWYPWLTVSQLRGAVEEAIDQVSFPVHRSISPSLISRNAVVACVAASRTEFLS